MIKGSFQPKPFYDSMIDWDSCRKSVCAMYASLEKLDKGNFYNLFKLLSVRLHSFLTQKSLAWVSSEQLASSLAHLKSFLPAFWS